MTITERQETPKVASDDSTWSSAPKLSRKVRELAHRSFHALKSDQERMAAYLAFFEGSPGRAARPAWSGGPAACKIHDRNLEALIPWIDALRQQIEDRLHAVTAGD